MELVKKVKIGLIGLTALVVLPIIFPVKFTLAQTSPKRPGSEGPVADPAIGNLLKQMDLKYEITPNGNYRTVIGLDNGRTQLLYINSNTEQLGNFNIREVWSPGYVSKGALAANIANKLLTDSNTRKLGSWEVVQSDANYLAIYNAKIPANVDIKVMASTMILVAKSADDIEKDLTGKDDL